jgi:hypothetical protein
LRKAWEQTGRILFAPFDAGKWFMLGFAAWLATLGQRYFPSLNFQLPVNSNTTTVSGNEELISHGPLSWTGLDTMVPAVLAVTGLAAVFFILGISITLLWVNSRGKFLFLNDLLLDRTDIVKPWKRFAPEGNSLFIWRLVFNLVCLGIGISMLVATGLLVMPCLRAERLLFMPLAGMLLAGILLAVLTIAGAYINLFLEDFIIPLMHRHRLHCNAAWVLFMKSLRKHMGAFLLYGLFKLLLVLIINTLILLITLVTCCMCCLGILLMMPYIGTVILLPIPAFLRLFSVEFISQFGGNFDCRTAPPEPAPPALPYQPDPCISDISPEFTD